MKKNRLYRFSSWPFAYFVQRLSRERQIATLVTAIVAACAIWVLADGLYVSQNRARQVSTFTSAEIAQCPWLVRSVQASSSPSTLAGQVLNKMSTKDKARMVTLRATRTYENVNAGDPGLCIPPLTLSDGPNGIAYGTAGVTQLPASIGIAASFNPRLANAYGIVLGQEAKTKGIDVLQGPDLNLARVPESGRIYEGYGEDPYLTTQMGTADIKGIQSTGVMAQVKHFAAYSQETARLLVDQVIPTQALFELYLAPFESAVNVAHVASVMCSYGSVDGTNDCSNQSLYQTLYGTWGFTGFVRSDLRAVADMASAFNAGMSMIKPATPVQVMANVSSHQLSISALNNATRRILTQMFKYGLIGQTSTGNIKANAQTRSHIAFALSSAEQSMVLLANNGTLPLSRNFGSIAVIGSDASLGARTVGNGSSKVRTTMLRTPLAAIKLWAGHSATVTYTQGDPKSMSLPGMGISAITSGQPLTSDWISNIGLRQLINNPDPQEHREGGKSDIGLDLLNNLTPATATVSDPNTTGPGWVTWAATVSPPTSGLYDISLTSTGDCWLSVDGHTILTENGAHDYSPWTVAVPLNSGQSYHFQLHWLQIGEDYPSLGWENETPAINQAVSAAKKAHTAIVFASDYNSEGLDRPDLNLPGAESALIQAVAAVNPRTIVVLNTGGAVYMPWISQVGAVLEAWYPGEQDGPATAATLFGSSNPSGRLPITFPPSGAPDLTTSQQWPGNGGTVTYSEGLDMGYRWYESQGLQPLFPFGYGLSYSTFGLGSATMQSQLSSVTIRVRVTNTSKRTGSDVVECYLDYPASAGEPPHQLRAFARVTLDPGQSKVATLSLSRSAFQIYAGGQFIVPPGAFTAWVGSSSEDLPISIPVTPPAQ